MNPSLRNLTALVVLILAGTALTVGSYLASKRPIPGPTHGTQEASLQGAEDELVEPVICPVSGRTSGDCGRERTS